jgi:hypothetical protein
LVGFFIVDFSVTGCWSVLRIVVTILCVVWVIEGVVSTKKYAIFKKF